MASVWANRASSCEILRSLSVSARFAREIFTGVHESDMGLWTPDAASALRLRADGGRPDLKLLFNINAEFIRQARSEGVPMDVEKLVQKRIGVYRKNDY